MPPLNREFKTFTDLITGYRRYHLIESALESGVLEEIGKNGIEADKLTFSGKHRKRFLEALEAEGLIITEGPYLLLSPFSAEFLIKEAPHYQGETIHFEKKLQGPWQNLLQVVKEGRITGDKRAGEYEEDLRSYCQAMEEAAEVRAWELWENIPLTKEEGVIIDLGGGTGTYLKAFLKKYPGWKGVHFELEDVSVKAEKKLAPLHGRIQFLKGDFYQSLPPLRGDLVLLSNVIHCHGEEENRKLLPQAAGWLNPRGLLVIHDFFKKQSPGGYLYDLHMMVNTYNGRTYTSGEVTGLIPRELCSSSVMIDLPSGTGALLCGNHLPLTNPVTQIINEAEKLGFMEAKKLDPRSIPLAPWVREMCRKGCPYYSKAWACPPHSHSTMEMREFLAGFSLGLLITGQPPLEEFQEKLLKLEELAKGSFKKAHSFTAGHCTLCKECPPEGCRNNRKMRYSLEACGVDVFGLMEREGIPLEPVKEGMDFITYVGVLLLE